VQLTGGAGLLGAARALAVVPLWPWEGEGEWLGAKTAQPRGGECFSFFFFCFLFLISIFYFHFFLSLFLLNNNLLTNLRC
jgi:hypothetical protein